jgi:hypothetical protein
MSNPLHGVNSKEVKPNAAGKNISAASRCLPVFIDAIQKILYK